MTGFSLAHLTVLSLPPPEMLRVAADTGYDTVGLRLLRVSDTTPGYPLMDDRPLLRATRAAMADTGVGVFDIEFVQLRPETDVDRLLPLLEAGGELGARWVIAAPYDPEVGRLTDRFAALCDRAAPFGLGVAMEFFPWTVLPGVRDAHAVVAAADRPNGAVLVDALHADRGPTTPDDIAAIPAARLPFVHLCDAPAGSGWTTEQLLHTARVERMPPGEGGIDLPAILAALPPGIPAGVEVPMPGLMAASGPEAVARRARAAAGRIVAACEPFGAARATRAATKTEEASRSGT